MDDPSGVRRRPAALASSAAFVIGMGAAVWALVAERHRLAASVHQLTWLAIIGSAIAGLAAVVALLLAWTAAVRESGVALPLRDGARLYALGQLGKYLPGAVWPVVAQAYLARRRGYSPRRVAAGSILALTISVSIALLVGGVLLPAAQTAATRRLWWVPLVAAPLIVALYPSVLNRLIAFGARVLRRPPVDVSYTWHGVVACGAWSLLGSILFGLHIYLLLQAVDPHQRGVHQFVLATCAYGFASAVGVLIVFLPAGAGAREATLTLVLAAALDVRAALVVALVSRAILIAVDVGLALSQLPGVRHRPATDTESITTRDA